MPRILAIETDPKRRTILRQLVNEHVRSQLFIADTVQAAIEQLGRRVPDVVLAPALLSPQDEAALSDYMKQLQGAPYVQVLTIPAFDMLGEPEVTARRGQGIFRRQQPVLRRYDRSMVGAQIADAVTRARDARIEYVRWLGAQAEREELEKVRQARTASRLLTAGGQTDASASDERRTALRKSLGDVPWLSGVRLAWDADISLVNISESGVLLESGSKFSPGSTTELHLSGRDANLVVPVRFVRSEIAKIDARGVKYHAAAQFGHEIDLAGPRSAREAATGATPQALAALLERALEPGDADEPAHARFLRGLRMLVGAQDVRLRSGVAASGGGETLYFEVPGDDRGRGVLQVVFDRRHDVTASEVKFLRAAAWMIAAALEFDRADAVVTDAPAPLALLEAQVA